MHRTPPKAGEADEKLNTLRRGVGAGTAPNASPFVFIANGKHGGNMLEEAGYQQLLADLEQERENIERMIVWVKGRMQQSDSAEVAATPTPKPGLDGNVRFPRLLPSDAFFRLSVPDAIKKYLSMVKRPKTGKQITTALDTGGLTHQAKNLYQTVYPTLLRMERDNLVVRVGEREWGLAEWYPSGRKATLSEKVQEAKEESEK
jgi:hypothetical protein